MNEITVTAEIANLEKVLDFVNGELEKTDCSPRTNMQISIAVEEIFTNIARYAYNPETGAATVCCSVGGEPLQVTIQFTDRGIPYNPLEKGDPDTSLPVEQREIGGLGIFMVKKNMDSISYSYENGKNILTIRKKL